MSTVLLLLDAFRYDYLDKKNTPFLYQCSNEGEYYETVEQSYGFCERSEMLTGMSGKESGFFTAIGYDPNNSPYKNTPYLSTLEKVEGIFMLFLKIAPERIAAKIHKRLRSYVRQYFSNADINMAPYMIPFTWLPYFALTEDQKDFREYHSISYDSIFTLLDKEGYTYFYETFTALNYRSPYSSTQQRFNAVIEDIRDDPKDFYLLYLSGPDAYGHRFGPGSQQLKNKLNEMDHELNEFVKKLEQTDPGNKYLFLGDHGMLPVTVKFDAGKEIDHLLATNNLKKGEDVIYFLDSTMVRLWAMNDKAEDCLSDVFGKSKKFNKNGMWLNKDKASKLEIPWPDRRYGDSLWLANPGVLVFPDFFHRIDPCKGMHGYNPTHPESKGMCILWGEKIDAKNYSKIKLNDVFDLLKKCLKL